MAAASPRDGRRHPTARPSVHGDILRDLLGSRTDRWLQFVAVLHEREEVRRLLPHLYLWSEPRPLHPARGPPDQHETFDFP